jgi:hypothetical protein
MTIATGHECIQGVRGKTMVFDSASQLEPPKNARVVIQGPSFRYYAPPQAGSDSFKLLIVGSSMRKRGTSTLVVDVQVR